MSVARKSLPNVLGSLPLLALSIDLLTPFLIWKNILPAEIRWISHLVIALMIVLAIFHVLSTDRIPAALWFALAVVVLWSYVALGHRQGISSTLWGIWLLFQFPLICLFAYLQANPTEQSLVRIRRWALILLGVEVTVQLVQYAFGEQPGDNLAGLFGRNGTGIAFVFAVLINCLYLGYWIASKNWTGLIRVLSLGLLSSVLGELKIFPFVITVIGLVAALIYSIKYHSLLTFAKILVLVLVASLGFTLLYNAIVPAAGRVPFQAYLQDPTRLYDYLYFSKSGYNSQGARFSNIGRMEAIQVGVEALQQDPVTLLFGYGIGTRGESRTLGTTGVGLSSGDFGFSSGTSLLVLMQETGVVGLAMLGCFILGIILTLSHDIRRMPNSPANSLRYALIFFSILWPVLLWYTNVWTMRVPMLGYWYLLGYVLAESRGLKTPILEAESKLSLQRA